MNFKESWQRSFIKLCEETKVVGEESGWIPVNLEKNESLLPSYIKTHSYGEFIFDWAWADLYQRVGVPYYPKLLHALPFTPVNSPKILGNENSKELIQKAINFYKELPSLSSHHWLFTHDELNETLEEEGYFIQKSLQYHFHNRWSNMNEFLCELKSRKRKQIKKERKGVENYGLIFEIKKGSELNTEEMQTVFELYLTTIGKKHSYAYLNNDFFLKLPKFLDDQLMVIFAKDNDNVVAMSSFYLSDDAIYGRYWGIYPQYQGRYPYLHFEMCYYKGMEFCMVNGLRLFEAGAQGEQKLLRGFEPVIIYSAHHIKEPKLGEIIKRHVCEQNKQIEDSLVHLKKHLPYKDSAQ